MKDLFGYEEKSINQLIDESCMLLQKMEESALQTSEEGFYVANSFGKDSGLIKALAQHSGVKFQDYHNQTTIDPPELIYFGREYHSDCVINKAKKNMFSRIEEKGLPTRTGRWCCEEYKEGSAKNRVLVLGVRKAESKAREARWEDVKIWTPNPKKKSGRKNIISQNNRKVCVNPILNYTDEQVWQAHEILKVPHCSLYDEGFDRIGCVGCPLASKHKVDREFERWPRFKEGWRRSAIRHWEKRNGQLNRTGELYAVNKFKTGEDYFYWWENRLKMPNYNGCLFGMI